MSDYVQSTNFATKDALASGNPLKIVKGTELNTEFANIAIAVATKADLASPTFTGTPALPTGATGVTQSVSDDSTKLATTAFVQDVVLAVKEALYPVGSIYVNSSVTTNPATLLGFGTWTAFGAGRVMVGFNASDTSFDVLEETGGSKDAINVSHTHTASTNTASLSGTLSNYEEPFGSASGIVSLGNSGQAYYGGSGTTANRTATINASHSHTVTVDSAGSSGTNANLQPYITVAMWKRTA